eukprot:TRINITY_DN8208_c0_g1_i13.p1 TRINITY_DN8208_c0_g1~~TRINITY_DN8208_c0_g1_i13.p1  ORF type:complete len:497 (-),score=164.38 TRINITY_DN8208_c0_g1_i13:95-1585(-)
MCIRDRQSTWGEGSGSKISRLQETSKYYAQKIETEKKRLAELEEEIKRTEKILENRRKDLRSDGKGSVGLLNEIKSLEHQLEKALQKHNEAIAQNKTMREQIDALRRERVIYDNIYKQLEKELNEKKEELKEITEMKIDVEKNREETLRKLENVKKKVQADQRHFEKDYQKVFKYLDQENQNEKIREKFPEREASRNGPRSVSASNSPERSPGRDPREDSPRRPPRDRKTVKNPEQTVKNLRAEVEEYEMIVQRLQKETEVDDVEKIVELFQSLNDKNHSLYLQVNELSDEIEKLEKAIAQVVEEKRKYESREDHSDPKLRLIKKKKAELDANEEKQRALDRQNQEILRTINSLKVGIPIIFERIGCNTEEYMSGLLPNQGVNESNILQYLAVIEMRTNEILQMYDACQEPEGKKKKEDEVQLVTKMPAVDTKDPPPFLLGMIEKNLIAPGDKNKIDSEESEYLNPRDMEEKAKRLLRETAEKDVSGPTKPARNPR